MNTISRLFLLSLCLSLICSFAFLGDKPAGAEQLMADNECPLRVRWIIKRFPVNQVMVRAKIYFAQATGNNVIINGVTGNRGNTQNYIEIIDKHPFPRTLQFGQEIPVFITENPQESLLELTIHTNTGNWTFNFDR